MENKEQNGGDVLSAPYPFRPATPQDMADGFSDYAKYIHKQLNKFAYRQNDPEVARLYLLYRHSIEFWGKQTKEIFPELPELITDNFYAGLVRLMEYCKKAAQDKTEPKAKTTCDHSPDFQMVTWFGQSYSFNSKQAKIIELFWNSQPQCLNEKTIASHTDSYSTNYHLRDSFRSHGKYHSAWGTMIKSLGKGTYSLNRP